MTKDILGLIKQLTDTLEESTLDKLNLEEFLLNKVIKSKKIKMETKSIAFGQKVLINEMQNEAMGQVIIHSKLPKKAV